MSAWIWVALAAIIGGYIIDYQKNKLKWQNQTSSNEAELDGLKELTSQLKSRIENLEAIAAAEPDEFASRGRNSYSTIEVDDQETQREKNQTKVENIAKRKSKT